MALYRLAPTLQRGSRSRRSSVEKLKMGIHDAGVP